MNDDEIIEKREYFMENKSQSSMKRDDWKRWKKGGIKYEDEKKSIG